MLTKLAAPKADEWYKYLDIAQQQLNAVINRSIGTSPFKVMFGVTPRYKEQEDILETVRKEMVLEFQEQRDEIQEQAAGQIANVQEEIRRTFNKKRKDPNVYRKGDLVAIRRTQFGAS